MKQGKHIVFSAALACLAGLLLTGCETWTDEEGRHFMLFGTRGPSGVVSDEAQSTLLDDSNLLESTVPQGDYKAGDDYPDYDDASALAASKDDGCVSALSLRQGMVDDSPVLLEAREMTLTGTITLLEVELSKQRDVEIGTDIKLDSGEFKLIWVKPDGTTQVLADAQSERGASLARFETGVNRLRLVGKPVVFDDIQISAVGLV